MARRLQRARGMRTSQLGHARLVIPHGATCDPRVLGRELPTLTLEISTCAGVTDPIVDTADWLASEDFRAIDAACEASTSDAISVRGEAPELVVQVACEVFTRFQRHLNRRNACSAVPLFDAVLRAHRGLHDCGRPLVRADYDHALDTWQWMLRLAPEASLAAQLAALFHHVERLESDAHARVEPPDYQAAPNAHAAQGAELTYAVLRSAGVDSRTAARTREIVASHERRGRDVEVDLLNDADALSFFSLNSSGYLDSFGAAQTRRKVAHTLGRLGASAREKLALVRLRPDLLPLLDEAAAA
jgi:hypothetical protein